MRASDIVCSSIALVADSTKFADNLKIKKQPSELFYLASNGKYTQQTLLPLVTLHQSSQNSESQKPLDLLKSPL